MPGVVFNDVLLLDIFITFTLKDVNLLSGTAQFHSLEGLHCLELWPPPAFVDEAWSSPSVPGAQLQTFPDCISSSWISLSSSCRSVPACCLTLASSVSDLRRSSSYEIFNPSNSSWRRLIFPSLPGAQLQWSDCVLGCTSHWYLYKSHVWEYQTDRAHCLYIQILTITVVVALDPGTHPKWQYNNYYHIIMNLCCTPIWLAHVSNSLHLGS